MHENISISHPSLNIILTIPFTDQDLTYKHGDYQYFSGADIPKTVSWIGGTFLNHNNFFIGKIK